MRIVACLLTLLFALASITGCRNSERPERKLAQTVATGERDKAPDVRDKMAEKKEAPNAEVEMQTPTDERAPDASSSTGSPAATSAPSLPTVATKEATSGPGESVTAKPADASASTTAGPGRIQFAPTLVAPKMEWAPTGSLTGGFGGGGFAGGFSGINGGIGGIGGGISGTLTNPGAIGGGPPPGPADTSFTKPATPASEPPKAAVADAVIAGTTPRTGWRQQQSPQSGKLTAGIFDDNIDPKVFLALANKMASNSPLGELPAQLTGRRVVVLVKDKEGKPVAEANVVLRAGTQESRPIRTRADGRAVFVTSFDKLPDNAPLVAVVTPKDEQPVSETVAAGATRWDISLPSSARPAPKNLDLVFVLDTTGSMADELEYLKAEIRGISARIRSKFPAVEQRFALVCYRDEGDEYVTRRFDFTTSVEDFQKHLADQRADGGGDNPEAVHRGLEDAVTLRWRDTDTARVLFLVGDAPPHTQFVPHTMKALGQLRQRGIGVYPVACSGYDDACELVWRSCALLTGSQFLFLTDDSGVGNAHAEPRVPYYQVERLDNAVVRMVENELTGQRQQVPANTVIRAVGQKVN